MKKLALVASIVAAAATMAVYASTAAAEDVATLVCGQAPTACTTAGITPWSGWPDSHCNDLSNPVGIVTGTQTKSGTSEYTTNCSGTGTVVLRSTGFLYVDPDGSGPGTATGLPSCSTAGRNECSTAPVCHAEAGGYVEVPGVISAGGKICVLP